MVSLSLNAPQSLKDSAFSDPASNRMCHRVKKTLGVHLGFIIFSCDHQIFILEVLRIPKNLTRKKGVCPWTPPRDSISNIDNVGFALSKQNNSKTL